MRYPNTERQAQFIALADRLAGPIAARAAEIDRENVFPTENFAELRSAGYLTLTVPERYGGLGADLLEYALAQERIAHACGATGLASSMHLSMVGRLGAAAVWPEPIYAELCDAVVADGALINAINSEPTLGSPSRGALPTTTASRTASGWRINGRKAWASLAPALTHIFSLATILDDGEPRRGNFLIPAAAPGVRVEPTWDNLGMRGTASHDIIFTDVDLPADACLPAEPPAGTGDIAIWYLVPSAAVYLGIAQAARDEAIAFARGRQPNGMAGTLAELPAMQQKFGEMDLRLLQARTLLYATTEEWLARPDEAARAELAWQLMAAKLTVTRAALDVTDQALRVAGSAGLRLDSPLQRYFRDARTALGHPPMEDVVLGTIGKAAVAAAAAAETAVAAPA